MPRFQSVFFSVWAGGCVAPQSQIDLDMLPRRALPAAHFDRNATSPVTDLIHKCPIPNVFWRTVYVAGVGRRKYSTHGRRDLARGSPRRISQNPG
jgi:hypothetical protein